MFSIIFLCRVCWKCHSMSRGIRSTAVQSHPNFIKRWWLLQAALYTESSQASQPGHYPGKAANPSCAICSAQCWGISVAFSLGPQNIPVQLKTPWFLLNPFLSNDRAYVLGFTSASQIKSFFSAGSFDPCQSHYAPWIQKQCSVEMDSLVTHFSLCQTGKYRSYSSTYVRRFKAGKIIPQEAASTLGY